MNIDLTEKEIKFLLKCLKNNFAEDQEDIFDQKSAMSQLLIGKLALHENRENRINIKKYLEYLSDTEFTDPGLINFKLFTGCGNCIIPQINHIHKKIKFAIYELDLIEQNGLFGSKFNKEMDFICKNNIKKSLIEIINAFGFSAKDVLQT